MVTASHVSLPAMEKTVATMAAVVLVARAEREKSAMTDSAPKASVRPNVEAAMPSSLEMAKSVTAMISACSTTIVATASARAVQPYPRAANPHARVRTVEMTAVAVPVENARSTTRARRASVRHASRNAMVRRVVTTDAAGFVVHVQPAKSVRMEPVLTALKNATGRSAATMVAVGFAGPVTQVRRVKLDNVSRANRIARAGCVGPTVAVVSAVPAQELRSAGRMDSAM